MTNKFHVLDHPMLLFAGFSESGSTKDLPAGIIGVFDAKTGKAVSTLDSRKPVRIAQGSYHTKDALGVFLSGMKKSTKTADFLPQDVMHIEYSPYRKSQNEKWIIGWDGVSTCETLKFECGKTHRFRFRIYGEGVYNQLAKQVLRDVSITTACCDSDECSGGCPDNTLHCRKYTKMLVEAINKDVEISKFVRAEVVYPDIPVKTATHRVMSISVSDNGDQEALNAVQRQYPTMQITRTSRVGSISTYSTNCLINATIITDYTPSTPVDLAVCNVCPSGYTLTGAKDFYTISANEATYANAAAVVTAYQNAGGKTFNGTVTGVNVTTNAITSTAHGFVTGQRVLYTNGGGTAPTGLVTATNYFVIKVDANTLKLATTLANSFAGTAIDITAVGIGTAHTLTPSDFAATLLNTNNVTEIYQLEVISGIVMTALSNDMISFTLTRGATCTPSSPSAITWVKTEDKYIATQKKQLILAKTCGNGARLADVVAAYANNTNIVSGSVILKTAGTCEDIYELEQYSECMSADGCLSEPLPVFPTVVPFENTPWGDVICPTVVAPTEANKCGIRFEVSSNYDTFGECSWTPEDYYTYLPTHMEVWEVEDDGEPCGTFTAARKVQSAIQENQTGQWAKREYLKLASYLYNSSFENDPRSREIFDQNIHNAIDLKAFYNVIYIKYRQYRGNNIAGNIQNAEVYEIPVLIKEGVDTKPVIAWFNKMFSPFNLSVQTRFGESDY